MRWVLRLLVGLLGGIAVAVAILTGGWWTLHALEPDKRFALEHSTVYLVLVLGAGFGALTAALWPGNRSGGP
ncbi:MAG: hypothetical protein SNJ75_12330 [Gemmataceae bacterium]